MENNYLNDVIASYSFDYKYAGWNEINDDILQDDNTPSEILDILYEDNKANTRMLRGLSVHPNASAAIMQSVQICMPIRICSGLESFLRAATHQPAVRMTTAHARMTDT